MPAVVEAERGVFGAWCGSNFLVSVFIELAYS